MGRGGMALGVGGGPMAPGGAAAARDTMFRVGNGEREWCFDVWMTLGVALSGYGELCCPCVVVGERGCDGLVVKKSSAREGRSCERALLTH